MSPSDTFITSLLGFALPFLAGVSFFFVDQTVRFLVLNQTIRSVALHVLGVGVH